MIDVIRLWCLRLAETAFEFAYFSTIRMRINMLMSLLRGVSFQFCLTSKHPITVDSGGWLSAS